MGGASRSTVWLSLLLFVSAAVFFLHEAVKTAHSIHDSAAAQTPTSPSSQPQKLVQRGASNQSTVVRGTIVRPGHVPVHMLLPVLSEDDALLRALCAACGLSLPAHPDAPETPNNPESNLGLIGLRTEDGAIVKSILRSIQAVDAADQREITFVLPNRGPNQFNGTNTPKTNPCADARSQQSTPSLQTAVAEGDIRLPRVVMATIGSGRYRDLAIAALESAVLHFGGDCIPSFHLLTDNTTGVASHLNPVLSPFRQWPDSGLSKYEDILAALRSQIDQADFFYFLDADVLFEEAVLLGDVSGDLVGVEHPMYPRNHEGWCNRKDGQPMCTYPYDRNPRSHAYIPEDVGKFYHTSVGGQGVRRTYLTTSWWYLQSAFWGGRSRFVLEMLDELADRVEADRKAGIYSMVVQDERYFNYYIHREAKNSSKNYRILPHAFLYPFRDEGFGDWVTKFNRPIIYHGTKVPGKLLKGEVQIQAATSTECLGFFLDPLVGMFGCHGGGGMQGWIPETSSGDLVGHPVPENVSLRFRQATTMKGYSKCIGGDLNAGEPVKLQYCRHSKDSLLWRYSAISEQLVNVKSGLCLDAVKKPPHKRDPVLVNVCSDQAGFQKWQLHEIGVGTRCTQKWCEVVNKKRK